MTYCEGKVESHYVFADYGVKGAFSPASVSPANQPFHTQYIFPLLHNFGSFIVLYTFIILWGFFLHFLTSLFTH